MEKSTKQLIIIGAIIVGSITAHHLLMQEHFVAPVHDPPAYTDCITEITEFNAGKYISQFRTWVDGTSAEHFRAHNTNACLYEAMVRQTEDPAEDQTGIRVYYGLTNSGIEAGSSSAEDYIKFILIPTDTERNNLSNESGKYFQVDTDINSWRPCPPYCDRSEVPEVPIDGGDGPTDPTSGGE